MKFSNKSYLGFLTSKLSRRIVFWIFLSVIVIETIILVPSLMRRKDELLTHLKEVTEAKLLVVLMDVPIDAPETALLNGVRKLRGHDSLVGGALYTPEGRKLDAFGEAPELTLDSTGAPTDRYLESRDQLRFDAVWTPADLNRPYLLILRHDATSVGRELYAFIFRIAGLVLIISVFVTGGAWIALRPIVVMPILKLRKDLLRVGEAIRDDEASPAFASSSIQRSDELGEVITAFKKMYRQIVEAISERKRAEAALQHSLQQVEDYSKALNNELEKGRQIQDNFLPSELRQFPGWEFAASFKPARQVAGDFYDVFPLPGNKIALVVADVCDKGVGAALFMALFRSLIRIFSNPASTCSLPQSLSGPEASSLAPLDQPAAVQQSDPMDAVFLANDYIARNHGDLAMFATLFYGVLDLADGQLAYINGGHEPLFVIDLNGRIRQTLQPTGPAVGVQVDTRFETGRVRLRCGDLLFGYTDGIPEATSSKGEFFSSDRLLDLLKTPTVSAEALVERIAEKVNRHTGEAEQFDDITILAVRRLPSAEQNPNPPSSP